MRAPSENPKRDNRRLVIPIVLAITATASIVALGAGAPGCGKSSSVVDAGHCDATTCDTPLV